MKDAVILVFANKQDQKNGIFVLIYFINFMISFFFFKALKPDQLQERLGLFTLKDRVWYIQPCSAIKGDGLYEGLMWLSTSCKS
jgi:hypothetical protein